MAIDKPYTPSFVAVKSNSEQSKIISWSMQTDATHPCSSIAIYRNPISFDTSGSVSSARIATLAGSARSYTDTSAPSNSAFDYTIVASNSVGESRATTLAVFNTPAAPTLTGSERITDELLRVKLTNPAYYATSLIVERQLEGSESWESVGSYPGKVTSFEDSTEPRMRYRYRARNYIDQTNDGAKYSDWSAPSTYYTAACAPGTPTLLTPLNGQTIDCEDASAVFTWRHEPRDGSSQQRFWLRYSADDGETWKEISGISGEAVCNLSGRIDPNTKVMWQVRTQGAYAEPSPWSSVGTFFAAASPEIKITRPSALYPITNVPLHIELEYEDRSGSLAGVQIQIRAGSDQYAPLVCAYEAGTNLSIDIPVQTFMPLNKTTYTITVQARSSSSLQTSTSQVISIDFIEPMLCDVSVKNDEDTGYAYLATSLIQDWEREEVAEISIWRVSDGARKLLAEHLQVGASIVDMYAPLNVDYTYEIISFASSGVYAVNTVACHFASSKAYFYWNAQVAYLDYNPEVDIDISRPSKQQVYYAGRSYPVSYDSLNLSLSESFSGRVYKRDNALALRQMVIDGGRCIYKSLDGDVYNADADVSFKPNFVTTAIWGDATVNLTRIDGGLL